MDVKEREVKIFLASSNELIEERKEFTNILNELNSQPNISRNFKLVPVRWGKDAFGAGLKPLIYADTPPQTKCWECRFAESFPICRFFFHSDI